MNDENTPQWSDWHVREIGFADSPQMIVCRVCHKPKAVRSNSFRKQTGSGTGFSDTCRTCETKTKAGRTLNSRVRRLQLDPSLSETDRAHQILEMPRRVAAESKALKRASERDNIALGFRQRWTHIRRIVVFRKYVLQHRISASAFKDATYGRNSGTLGLAQAMDAYPAIGQYVRTMKAFYANIVHRMHKMERWAKAIGVRNLPPAYWMEHVDPIVAQVIRNRNMNVKFPWRALPAEHVYALPVSELLTDVERDTLSRMAQGLQGVQAWEDLVDTTRRNAALPYLLLPWLRTPDPETGEPRPSFHTLTPDWLKQWAQTPDKEDS